MESFDFNIQNYSFKEMEDLLGLASNKKYNANDVALCKQRLNVKLASSGKGGKKMTNFLESASHCLISKMKDNGHNNNHDKLPQKYYSPAQNFKKNTFRLYHCKYIF